MISINVLCSSVFSCAHPAKLKTWYCLLIWPCSFFLVRSLFSILPVTLINKLLVIIKFAVTVSIVVVEVSFVNPSVFPLINSISRFLIPRVMPLIIFRALFLIYAPKSVPTPHTLLKISFVEAAILPQVFSKAFRKTIDVFAFVVVPISIVLRSLPVFEPVFEASRKKIPYNKCDKLPLTFWWIP